MRVETKCAVALFPLLETLAFAGGIYLQSIWLLLLAAFLLSLSVHISFHEWVHRTGEKQTGAQRFVSYLGSLALGLPVDAYRWHHYQHHKSPNGPEDYSSTWHWTRFGPVPMHWFTYSVLWPWQLARAHLHVRALCKDREIPAWIIDYSKPQKWFLAVAVAAMFVIAWRVGVAYLGVIYLGWVFTALHNYGQHPPTAGNPIPSIESPMYNGLLFNNGLHWEHHDKPALSWHELQPSPQSVRISLPHPLHALKAGVK